MKRTHLLADTKRIPNPPKGCTHYGSFIGFDASQALHDRFKAEAEKRGVSMAILGRAAINKFLESA